MRNRPVITCTSCGNEGRAAGHGWCEACYGRWRRAGRPAGGPPQQAGGAQQAEVPLPPRPAWDDREADAALMVADLADGVDDCRYLLDALGLWPGAAGQIGGVRDVA